MKTKTTFDFRTDSGWIGVVTSFETRIVWCNSDQTSRASHTKGFQLHIFKSRLMWVKVLTSFLKKGFPVSYSCLNCFQMEGSAPGAVQQPIQRPHQGGKTLLDQKRWFPPSGYIYFHHRIHLQYNHVQILVLNEHFHYATKGILRTCSPGQLASMKGSPRRPNTLCQRWTSNSHVHELN